MYLTMSLLVRPQEITKLDSESGLGSDSVWVEALMFGHRPAAGFVPRKDIAALLFPGEGEGC